MAKKIKGFIIVNQITVGGAEFVLGVHEKILIAL